MINTRRVNQVNQIDISQYDKDFEINEAHVQNTNYKGKNYDPNYQNRNKTSHNNNNSSNSTSSTVTGYNKFNTGSNTIQNKNNFQDKPTNVQVTLTEPVNRDQFFKIQKVLQHPSQYSEKLPPNARPATGEYTKSFNKFLPKKVEVNEATVDEVIGFGHFTRKSDAGVIDQYKALRDDIPYGPEDQQADPPQQD